MTEGAKLSAHLGKLAHEADAALALGVELGGDALLAVVVVGEGLRDGARLVPQAVVQEEAVHERPQQRRAHQVPQAQFFQLSTRDKPGRVDERVSAMPRYR